MEQLHVFDCSNVLIASFFTDDRGCAHENREHTLIYLCSGELEIEERGKKTILHPGECAFMRRDNRMWLQKRADEEHPYRSVVLKFTKPFLRELYQTLDKKEIPMESKREKASLRVLPNNRPDIRSLFESVIPYFDTGVKPSDDVLKLKMIEGAYVLFNTDKTLYASLFDFVDPWKIDIIDYLNRALAPQITRHGDGGNSKLYGPQSGDIQTRFCQSQRTDTAKMDYQTSIGGRSRVDKIRQEKSDRSLFRCRIQESFPFLESL